MIPEHRDTRINTSKNQKARYILVFSVILTIIILFLIGLYVRWTEWSALKEQKVKQSLLNVRVLTIHPEHKMTSLVLPGFLDSYNVTPILARANGYLKQFYVDIGDHVHTNQLLCEIETPDIDAEWLQAKADLESALAKQDIAKITANRWEGLWQKDAESISKQEVDQTFAQYQAAIADVNAAKANLERLEILKDFKYVYAPFDGVITERNIDLGSLITVGNETLTQPYVVGGESLIQPLFKINNSKIIRVFVEVPQPYYPQIKDGVNVDVTVPEHPDKVFKGTIDRNASALDPVSRTLFTQINIDNNENILLPGLYSEVSFTFEPYREEFEIPIAALLIRDGPPCVAIVEEDNTVRLQKVEIGRDFGKGVQIINGLHDGNRIILNPNYRIKDGVKVNTNP